MYKGNVKRLFKLTRQDREILIEALQAFYQSRLKMDMDFPEILEVIERIQGLPEHGSFIMFELRAKTNDFRIVTKALDEMVGAKKQNNLPYDRTMDLLLRALNARTPKELRKEKALRIRGEKE